MYGDPGFIVTDIPLLEIEEFPELRSPSCDKYENGDPTWSTLMPISRRSITNWLSTSFSIDYDETGPTIAEASKPPSQRERSSLSSSAPMPMWSPNELDGTIPCAARVPGIRLALIEGI